MGTTTIQYQKKEIKLTDKNYLGEGGEGVAYLHGGLIFKIYHSKKDVIPAQKIAELAPLARDNIIGPIDHVRDLRGVPVGYAMKFVQDSSPLARLFTTSFRNRNNVTPEDAAKLVRAMCETIQFIHQKDVLIVDGNEFNYLVDGATFRVPYFIDVDSYQTKSFPAKVIMPSIKDWHSKDFSPLTDWFSFAVVATQIFVGVHPYKGSCPGFASNDTKARQLANKSIFGKGVALPPATRDFGLIPSEYLGWFVDVFEKGVRTAPPLVAGRLTAKPTVTIATGKDKFVIDRVFTADSNITGCSWTLGNRVIYTERSLYVEAHAHPLPSKSCGIVWGEGAAFAVDVRNNLISARNFLTGEEAEAPIAATRKVIIDNRLYAINEDKLVEVKFRRFGGRLFVAPGNAWDILPNSTQAFREVIVADAMGRLFLYIPFKEDSCAVVAVPELARHKVLDAKHEGGVCMLLTFKDNVYHRVTVKFDGSYSKYVLEAEDDVIPYGVNFVCLPNGVYLHYTGEGEVVIGGRDRPEKKIFSGIKFDGEISLCHSGLDVYYHSANELFRIKVR